MSKPALKRHRIAPLGLALGAVLALTACGSAEQLDPGNAADAPDFGAAIAAAPPKLAALYARGPTLLDGGLPAYEREIARLRGFPIVVNKWASWCGPCREEFPYLQEQAAERADEVAFLGINSNDSVDAATTFLRDHPVPYPSFADPDLEIARALGAGAEFPATIFYGANGEIANVHLGVYSSAGQLAADVERYALGG